MPNSLPLIVGFGGYSAAGRSSSHQAFRRMILESLPAEEQLKTIVSLACLMAQVTKEGEHYRDQDGVLLSPLDVDSRFRQQVLDGTLIRKIELFDPANIPGYWPDQITQFCESMCHRAPADENDYLHQVGSTARHLDHDSVPLL